MKYVAGLLLVVAAGCASAAPPTPQVTATQPAAPQPVASQPVASQPVALQPVAPQPARAAAAPPNVKTPAPKPAAPAAASRAAASTSPATPATASPATPASGPALDLDGLKARLRATKAIGVFTKLSLKNKVDDLMKQFTEHYQGKRPPIAELRQSYDLLMLKVLSLLQDSDQPLASAIVSSREAIWALLADQKKFAALQS